MSKQDFSLTVYYNLFLFIIFYFFFESFLSDFFFHFSNWNSSTYILLKIDASLALIGINIRFVFLTSCSILLEMLFSGCHIAFVMFILVYTLILKGFWYPKVTKLIYPNLTVLGLQIFSLSYPITHKFPEK